MKLRIEKFNQTEQMIKDYPNISPFTFVVSCSYDGENWSEISGRHWCGLDGAMEELNEYKNPPVGKIVYEEELAD